LKIKRTEKTKKSEIEKWDIGKINKKQVEEVEDVNEMWIKVTKRGINEEAGKIIGKKERPQRNSWFVKECHIVLESKKRAYNKMIN